MFIVCCLLVIQDVCRTDVIVDVRGTVIGYARSCSRPLDCKSFNSLSRISPNDKRLSMCVKTADNCMCSKSNFYCKPSSHSEVKTKLFICLQADCVNRIDIEISSYTPLKKQIRLLYWKKIALAVRPGPAIHNMYSKIRQPIDILQPSSQDIMCCVQTSRATAVACRSATRAIQQVQKNVMMSSN